jgi:hypothetical protein
MGRRRCFPERSAGADQQRNTNGGLNMADKSSLRLMGFLFGGITFAVTLIAFLVVRSHVEGRLQLDDIAMGPPAVSVSTN